MKKILIAVALVLIVPIVLGNITARVLEVVSPAPAAPLIANLEHVRMQTRIALGVIGVYYVGVIVAWLVLRKRKQKAAAASAP